VSNRKPNPFDNKQKSMTEDKTMKCSYCGRHMNTGTSWGDNDYLCTECSQLPDTTIEEMLGTATLKEENKYAILTLSNDGRGGDETLYAPISTLKELAKQLEENNPDLDPIGDFRKLITWEGKPTKDHPVVGAGTKGAAGIGTIDLNFTLDPTDEYSIEEFIMELEE
jgi:hypothetical protein